MSRRVIFLLWASLAAGALETAQLINADSAFAAGVGAQAGSDPIANAESAAPLSVSAKATIVQRQPDGSIKTLRQGTNGWKCSPGPPPRCWDANAALWMAAELAHKPPPGNFVGLVYMLKGVTHASNTDPFAAAPPAGADWVRTGPTLVIFGPGFLWKNYPSGPNPDTTAPFVMWAGTPYAHLMVPVTPDRGH